MHEILHERILNGVIDPAKKPGNARPVAPAAFFDAIARRYDREYARHRGASRDELEGLLRRMPPRGRVLDLGVGTGRELSYLLDAGYDVVGLDVSPAMLSLCARRGRPIPLIEADFWEPLPFGDAEFDVVLALHGTLAHPPSEDHFSSLSRELARVLRPKGLALFQVPSHGWLEKLEQGPPRRTGFETCLHEDPVSKLTIEVAILSPQRWEEAMKADFAVTCEALSDAEQLVVLRAIR